jgi:hypothetical protein
MAVRPRPECGLAMTVNRTAEREQEGSLPVPAPWPSFSAARRS